MDQVPKKYIFERIQPVICVCQLVCSTSHVIVITRTPSTPSAHSREAVSKYKWRLNEIFKSTCAKLNETVFFCCVR